MSALPAVVEVDLPKCDLMAYAVAYHAGECVNGSGDRCAGRFSFSRQRDGSVLAKMVIRGKTIKRVFRSVYEVARVAVGFLV
jgi:hypothetical protein